MTTLEHLIDAVGVPCFIKIDVEDYELQMIRGLNRSIDFLSFEVNLPEFLSEGLECMDILNRINGAGKSNYCRDCTEGLLLK